MKRYHLLAALASAALAPALAHAQAAPATAAAPAAGAAVSTGATVYDTAGATVGTVASTDGTNAVIDTGTVKAAVPLTSLGAGAKGPVLAMTKAQLDAAAGAQAQQASAVFKSQLVAGATVYGTGDAQLGTIKSVDATGVTLTTPQGEAKLPTSGFGPGPKGVTLGMTAAQLATAMGAAGAATAGAATSPDTATTGTAATATTPPATGTATTTAGSTMPTADGPAPTTPGTTPEATTTKPGATTTTTPPKKTRKPRK